MCSGVLCLAYGLITGKDSIAKIEFRNVDRKQDESGLCYYYHKFGRDARKCRESGSFQEKKKKNSVCC